VARNRQRSKQRQAERRARRLAEEQAAGGPPDEAAQTDGDGDAAQAQPRREIAIDDPTTVEPSAAVSPDLAVGAPPQDEGRSDAIFGQQPGLGPPPGRTEEEALDEQEALEEIEDWEVDDPDAAATGAGEAGYAARGRRGREDAEAHKHRSRVVQFLIAVWAELQRVQWPNRQALVTLTGVVLGFVLIAGGYLGLLDAIFSELIQALL
jgi:preprotein translocase subunit SecE